MSIHVNFTSEETVKPPSCCVMVTACYMSMDLWRCVVSTGFSGYEGGSRGDCKSHHYAVLWLHGSLCTQRPSHLQTGGNLHEEHPKPIPYCEGNDLVIIY